jgi:hypothetical protein
MGKLRNSLIGDIRGKIGEMVFTKNNSGDVIRSMGVQSLSGSPAQREQRNRLAKYPSLYKLLTPQQKRNWEVYAVTDYKPRSGNRSKELTGRNAFVGVNMLLDSCNSSMRPLTMSKNGGAFTSAGVNQTTFISPLLEPPTEQIENWLLRQVTPIQILDDAGWTFRQITSDFGCHFSMHSLNYPNFDSSTNKLTFLNSDYLSFMIMCSDGFADFNGKPFNPQMFTVASTGKFYFDKGVDFGSRYDFKFPIRDDMGDYWSAPIKGESVYMTLIAIGEKGDYSQLIQQVIKVT